MTNPEPSDWELARLEYETAVEQYRHMSGLRRQDIAFVTTVQGAIFSIIGNKLLALDFTSVCLSLLAVLVLFLGLNSEWRLAAYMKAYIQAAKAIEAQYSLSLLSTAGQLLQAKKILFSNSVIFPAYYLFFILVWLGIWLVNLLN